MFPIIDAKPLGPGVKQFEIEAPRIAKKQQAGQFVIIRLHDAGERIPLTIKASDPERGTITLVVQAIGKTTSLLNELGAGDAILDVVGPLGKPSEIERTGAFATRSRMYAPLLCELSRQADDLCREHPESRASDRPRW